MQQKKLRYVMLTLTEHVVERFSNERRKRNVTMPANQSQQAKQKMNQSENKGSERNWHLALHLIGRESGASFFYQSESAVKQNQCLIQYFQYSIKNRSVVIVTSITVL